jgi:hypothetical protein
MFGEVDWGDAKSVGGAAAPANGKSSIELSQRKQDADMGCVDYVIVVGRMAPDRSREELLHTYCTYHSMAGPVRPDPVRNLRIEDGKVKWEWSENSYDKASPGACFERPLMGDNRNNMTEEFPTSATSLVACATPSQKGLPHATPLAWAGPAVRVPKVKSAPKVPELPKSGQREWPKLAVEAVTVRTESPANDERRVRVTHKPTGKDIIWEGTSTAEFQSISGMRCSSSADGQVVVQFNYFCSENGDTHCPTITLVVRSLAGGNGIEWAAGSD